MAFAFFPHPPEVFHLSRAMPRYFLLGSFGPMKFFDIVFPVPDSPWFFLVVSIFLESRLFLHSSYFFGAFIFLDPPPPLFLFLPLPAALLS